MYVQSKSLMLPDEEYKFSNFPELATVKDDMDTFRAYMEKVFVAVSRYEERKDSRIYLNMAELRDMIGLSYRITDILGRADNVCFDILMNIRTAQEYLHELSYSRQLEGTIYVSDKKVSFTDSDSFEGVV